MKNRAKLRIIGACLLLIESLAGCTRSIDRDFVYAGYRGDAEEVKVLLQRGANAEALAMDGWTALTMAAREGHLDAAQVLLRSGAKVDTPEGGGNTALYWAAFNDHLD